MLDIERDYFREHRAEWAESRPGSFVLVKGRELVGVYSSAEDALTEGAYLFGLSPFLVRNVNEEEQEISVPALTLGIINADSNNNLQR